MEADEIDRAFQKALNEYLGKTFPTEANKRYQSSLLGVEKLESVSSKSKAIPLKFSITSSTVSLEEFKDYKRQVSKDLWKELEAGLMVTKLKIKEVRLLRWEFGSILIFLSLLREADDFWSEEEIGEIDQMLPDFAKIVESFLTEVHCTTERIKFEPRKYENDEFYQALLTFGVYSSERMAQWLEGLGNNQEFVQLIAMECPYKRGCAGTKIFV